MMIPQLISILLFVLIPHTVYAQLDFLEGLKDQGMDELGLSDSAGLSNEKIISGLKEALEVGTENTVQLTGNVDGYLKNEAIKILLPEKLQSMDKALRMVGFGPQIDEFVVSMNRSAEHERLAQRLAIRVFFADPHSPWQRGTNENTNGLLRQYLPKGTDLSGYTQRVLNAIAHRLNTRPRKCLDWATPLEVFTQLRHQSPVALGT
jgi:hypothetical protein